MTQTAFRYTPPPERKKLETPGSTQQNTVRRTGPKIVFLPLNEMLNQQAALKARLKTSNSVAPAIQSSIDLIAGSADAQPMTLPDAQTSQVAITLALPVCAPEPLSSSLSPEDVNTSSSVSAPAAVSVELVSKPPKAARKGKKQALMDVPVPIEKLKYLSIAQTALRYPAFSEKALRHLQAQAENYQRYPKAGLRSNGFINCIVRPAGQRKIIIDAEEFEQWLASCKV